MVSNKELKIIVGYIEKALYKKIANWSCVRFAYTYDCRSDVFGGVISVPVPIKYSIANGRLSITKHDNKIFFGIENLIKFQIKEDSLKREFVSNLWGGFNELSDPSFATIQDIDALAYNAYGMWCESGGVERIHNSVLQKISFIRGDFEIPCNGLDKKIIPVASLDLETMTLKYPKSRGGGRGVKVAVGDVIFTNINSWSDSGSSPYFLEGMCLTKDLFFASNQYEHFQDKFDIDKILLRALHERFPDKF